MSLQRACDVCHFYRQNGDGSTGVRRYGLKRDMVGHRERGVRVDRSQVACGSIDLCDGCWERIAKPRMNPRKSHPRLVA